MRFVEYHPEARMELIEAAVWYEAKSSGLGTRFIDQVERRVEASREQFAPGFPSDFDTRTLLVKRFSYKVVVRVESARVHVLAVSHLRRKDSYWHDRAGE